MNKDFWLKKWEANETPWHLNQVNQKLLDYWYKVKVGRGGKVLVPLCGKSKDMLWFKEEGYQVFGIELSPLAVNEFFKENNFSFTTMHSHHLTRYQSVEKVLNPNPLVIYQGDFFDWNPDELTKIHAFYDRAALIAFTPEQQKGYVIHLAHCLESDVQGLLLTYEYPESEMAGPPFSVSVETVFKIYEKYFEIKVLETKDILDESSLKQKGLSQLKEHIIWLKRK